MSASFLHGVEVIEITTGPVPITIVKSSVIGLVGTAPTWAVRTPAIAAPINVPTLVSSAIDAATFGPAVQGYTIPYALAAVQEQGAGQVVVVNVFNPSIHFSDVVGSFTLNAQGAFSLNQMGVSNVSILPTTTSNITAEAHTFGGTPATIQLAHGIIKASTMTVTSSPAGTTYVQGTDYSVDARTSVVTRLATGAITATQTVLVSYSYYSGTPYSATADYGVDTINGVIATNAGGTIPAGATVIASFSYADPTRVQDADIIGGVAGSNYTGVQSWLTTYGTMGFFPKILIAPGYAQNADVASALTTIAGTVRGMALVDAPPSTSVATAIANRGVAGNTFDTSSTRVVLCYPQEQFFDTGYVPTGVKLNGALAAPAQANANAVGPYSAWVAGAMAERDLQKGYWWSVSNMQVNGILGPDVTLYASILDAASDVNTLNGAGIVTVFNAFGSGLRVWGNRSAGYPTITTPDNFISVRRTMDVIEESVELSMLQFLDQPISNALITAILASVNSFVRTLIQRGALVSGSATYNSAENPSSAIAAGHLVFDIDVMPPPPAERISFNVYIDTTLLNQIGSTSSLSATAAIA